MEEFYIIESSSFDPYYNLALEEHLLDLAPEKGCILYLWQNQHTVVIGKNQNPWVECRTTLLYNEGGHLARRLSGGGAVYHDLGNLNFTFLCRNENFDLKKQLSVIQRAATFSDIKAEFSGRNDLLTEGKKFSGNAFYHGKTNSYHHGTILIQANMENLQRYLSPPKAKLESKGIQSVRSRVVNLSDISPSLTCEKMKQYMIQAFGDIYGHTGKIPLSEKDEKAIIQLKGRYQSQQWLFGRSIPFSCCLEGQFSFGHMQLQIQVKNGIISDIQVYTDAMDADLPQKLSSALKDCPFQSNLMQNAIKSLNISEELCSFIAEQDL